MNGLQILLIAIVGGAVAPAGMFLWCRHKFLKLVRAIWEDSRTRCPFCKRSGAIDPSIFAENFSTTYPHGPPEI